MVGRADAGEALARRAEVHMAAIAETAAALPRRPRVYFEEWDDPLITGIRWVGELIRIAGGDDAFPELAENRSRAIASSLIRAKSCAARPTSSSARGAANASAPNTLPRVRAGTPSRPCATANSTRSSRRSSCSLDRRPCSTGSMRFMRGSSRGRRPHVGRNKRSALRRIPLEAQALQHTSTLPKHRAPAGSKNPECRAPSFGAMRCA